MLFNRPKYQLCNEEIFFSDVFARLRNRQSTFFFVPRSTSILIIAAVNLLSDVEDNLKGRRRRQNNSQLVGEATH